MLNGSGNIDIDYPEMQLVWETIFEAITNTAERAQEQGRLPPEL